MKADIVICGAGIAGISAAYYLSSQLPGKRILLVDERAPLTLTSDKSSECYRNWWPDEAMVALMDHSLDLLAELALKTGNRFALNQRGYLYVTRASERIPHLVSEAQRISDYGAGPLRQHDGSSNAPYTPSPADGFTKSLTGADLLTNPVEIQNHFPYISPKVQAVLHVRRAGWFSAQQLGMLLLESARQNGVISISGKVENFSIHNNQVQSVHLSGGEQILTSLVVLAAGPLIQQLTSLLDIQLPVHNELHLKAVIKDHAVVLPRHAPLVINLDAQILPWSEEERSLLTEDPSTLFLTAELPGGAHTRPEGGPESNNLLLLWDYHTQTADPVYPLPVDSFYPEIALRGLVAIIPGLARYIGRAGRPDVDGGYYTRTVENRPIIGPLPVSGVYISAAYSGYGLMASLAAGELLASCITGKPSFDYAQSFRFDRYQDPIYQQRLAHWGDSGQL